MIGLLTAFDDNTAEEILDPDDDGLDGDYWRSVAVRKRTSDSPKVSRKELLDQKIITRLSNLVSMVERMKCFLGHCSGVLRYVGYMTNSFCLKTICSACGRDEKIHTAQLFILKHGDKQRKVYDIPYLEAVATRFIPGGGAATQSRFNTIMGLPSFGPTSLNNFYHGPLILALKAVHDKSIQENLAPVIVNSLLRDPGADGVSKFYPVTMSVDARWDKPWGWNALNSTIRMIESSTNLVMATITLHRKNDSECKFSQSAKACDSEGSALCLQAVTKLGFDVVEVIHDDDSSSMKKLIEMKAELALKPEFVGKISSVIKESLCTRYSFGRIFFISLC